MTADELAAHLKQCNRLVWSLTNSVCRTRPWLDAEDVAQEVRVHFILAARSFDPTRAKFSTWAVERSRDVMRYSRRERKRGLVVLPSAWKEFGGVKFTSIAGQRTARGEGPKEGVGEDEIPDRRANPAAEVEQAEEWARLTVGLTEPEREVLRLRFAEDLSMDEVAARVGVGVDRAWKIYSGAITTLRGRTTREASWRDLGADVRTGYPQQ